MTRSILPAISRDLRTVPLTLEDVQRALEDVHGRLAVVEALSPLANPVVGVAAGYKVARGEVALDGGNPTPVTHGLTTVVAVFLTLKGTAAPGDSTSVLSYDVSGATLNIYGWKHTTGGVAGNPTLVASTGTETVSWFAIGT